MIQFRALGTLVLRYPDGADVRAVLAQPKRVALLAYLALARPHGFHRRDTLLALLWPEQDERHARWALNQALRHLRNAVGKEAVSSRGDGEVGINSDSLWCDAVEFAAAVEQNDLARALELYRGDLLDGFHVSGCGEFERWLEQERVWLKGRAARAASALAEREAAKGDSIAAADWARRAFTLAQDDEGETRRLIELLGRVGDRAGAVMAYEQFARRLREEYEVEPAPETRASITAVRVHQAPQASFSPPVDEGLPSAKATTVLAPPVTVAPQRAPRRRSWRQITALGSIVLAGLGAAAIWSLTALRAPTNPAPPSSSTVAVLPFGYRGSPALAYLGEGMVDLLSANLNGAGETRSIDPRAVLALVGRTNPVPEPIKAQSAASRLGAGAFVLGDIVEAGGTLRISARLYGVPKPSESVVAATVQGNPSQLFQLVDGLTAQLIAGRGGGPAEGMSRLAALTTDSLSALKSYLLGERLFRAGREDSTVEALLRAVRIDPSFALAQYRLATAAMWANRRPLALQAVHRAQRHADRLRGHERKLIAALAASLQGRFVEAERIYREIVTQFPNDVEANYQLGDLIFHHHAILGRSWLEARGPLERVLSLDPSRESALYHLSNIAARERKLKELDSLTTRVLRLVAPPAWFFRGQRAVAFGDTVELAKFTAAIRTYSDDVAQPLTGFVVFTTGDLEVGRRLWRVIAEPSRARGVRVLARVTLAEIELMNGRWNAAKAELDAAMALDSSVAMEHRALLALSPLLSVPQPELLALRDALLKWKAGSAPSSDGGITAAHARAHPYLRLYLLGLLNARLGESDSAMHYAMELGRRARASFGPSFVGDLGRTVRAEVARVEGRNGEALAQLDSAGFWTNEDPELDAGMSPFYAHEYERFTRAELLNILGRHDEALRVYHTLADELFHSGAPAHFRMAAIYQLQGRRLEAEEHQAAFVELWKNCDPELRPLVDQAKQHTVQ